jgi:phosphohistidine swiveling domain-containing protein
MSTSVPTEIETGPDFPVTWPNEGDGQRFWEREVMHVPGQATMLDIELQEIAITLGFNTGCVAYEMPVRDEYLRINTYVYQSIAPVSHDQAEMEALGKRCQEKLGAAIPGQLARWENESLPELERMYAYWDSFDLEGASEEALAAHFEKTLELLGRAWEIHFLTVFPSLISVSLFQDMYQEVFGGADEFEPQRLLLGIETKTTEADRALHALSRKALAAPVVRETLETAAAADVPDELAGSDEGRAFLRELDGYLQEYGKRLRLFITFSTPSFVEDPTLMITALKDAISTPDRDPFEEMEKLASERERLIAAARERLASYPEAVREQFEFLLNGASQGVVLNEDHNFAIDCRVNYEVRRVLVEAGRRLARLGAIADPTDVWHLRLDEIRQGLGSPGADLSDAATEQKAEQKRFAEVQAPPLLGTIPPGQPPDNPIARAIGRLFGGPPKVSQDPSVIVGTPGSAGVARGRARVLRSLGDADRLGAGEVLVTETTAPPWTPLFARAAAIVTDSGGLLSHCAVVAREYGLPAVVGTKMATAAIRDGQLVEVDGDAGTVRLLPD